ncbi:MAG: hypothetical protein AAGE94_17900, partial [Acidobacteriota bacterium]
QEDELLEWATFWAFVVAGLIAAYAAVLERRRLGRLPWFQAGVALFCLVVAMEEISWGQRVLGYRPPVYFLEHNFQQELNVHNVVEKDLRKLALKTVIVGYGVVLPLLAFIPPIRRFFTRWSIVVPPWVLAPSFAATFEVYRQYPWRFSGEWVELMLGLGFLFVAVATVGGLAGRDKSSKLGWIGWAIMSSYLLVVGLGAFNATISRGQRGADPEILAAAQVELDALRNDFQRAGFRRCSNHKRLYTFREKFDLDFLLDGEFAALTDRGLPPERAEFFIDPWNTPYWIRDRCDRKTGRHLIFLYSFGPDRRRASSKWEIRGDDIGVIVYRKGFDD